MHSERQFKQQKIEILSKFTILPENPKGRTFSQRLGILVKSSIYNEIVMSIIIFFTGQTSKSLKEL